MQDFTSWTEVDTPGRLTQIDTRSTFMSLRGDDADVYLYKAIVKALSDFNQEFEFYIDAADPTAGDRSVALVSYVQDLDDWEANRAGNKNQISVMVDNIAAGPAPRVAIIETNGGSVYSSAATYSPAMDTLFYCTFVKLGADVTLYIYSDSGRTTLVATLTLTLQAAYAITYVMAPQSNGSGDADEISGYIQDMDDPESYEDLKAGFEVGQGSEELLGEFISQQADEEQLKAAFDGQVTENLLGKFISQQADNKELLGEFEARHTGVPVTLLGKFIAQHADYKTLLGEFIVRQADYKTLLGEFIVQHKDSKTLLGKFTAQHKDSKTLLAEFIVQQADYETLLGKFIVKQKHGISDPHCFFIVRHKDSKTLLGKFIVQQADYKTLKASFDGQVTENLLGKFVAQQADYKTLLGKFIAQQADYKTLLGKFIAQHKDSKTLLGKFVAQHKDSETLLGKFIVRHKDDEELLCGFVVRHVGVPVELSGHFRIDKDFMSKGLSVDVYQDMSIIA